MFVLGENHFRKCFSGNGDVWLVRKIEFSENWFPLTQKKWLWLQKSFYTFIFTSKYFRKKRERESERAIVDDRAPIQSDDCWRTPSSSPRRSRELQSDDRDLRSWLTVRKIAPSITISQHQSRASRLREIAISRRRSWSRLCEIAPSIAIDGAVVGLELAKYRAIEPSRASIVDDFFSGFFLSFVRVFLGLSFPSSFPNTRKYFSEIFLKCNQTHENIFFSGK